MGNPLDHLATQVDLVGELFWLTEGDLLLVRLYVDALVGQGTAAAYVRSAELQTLQPGLHGYFDRWWDEQHQRWTHAGRAPLVEQEQLLTLYYLWEQLGATEQAEWDGPLHCVVGGRQPWRLCTAARSRPELRPAILRGASDLRPCPCRAILCLS